MLCVSNETIKKRFGTCEPKQQTAGRTLPNVRPVQMRQRACVEYGLCRLTPTLP